MDSNDKTRIVRFDAKSQDRDLDKTLSMDEFDQLPADKRQQVLSGAAANIDCPDITLFVPPEGPRPHHFTSPLANTTAITKTVIKGRFELDTLLGIGGMGTVYKALDRRKIEAGDSKPYVAIKLLNDDFRSHPDAFLSLQSEARKCQALAHPNIVNVFDFDREGELVFMTMEFLEGLPLDKLLIKNSLGLPHEQAMAILKEISQALSHAHAYGIVHSDFKPGNIFITKRKGSKVFDFGIARAATGGSLNTPLGDKTLFYAGNLSALTPAYASYEMLTGQEPSTQDDVYALACVAYQLFGGSHPFNRTPADKAYKEKLKPRRLRQLSRRQWRALEAALEFKREKRTPSVDVFINGFFGKPVLRWLATATAALSLSLAALAYSIYNSDNAIEAEQIKKVVTQELKEEHLAQRVADKKEEIDRVLLFASMSKDWEENVLSLLKELQELIPTENSYRNAAKKQVSQLFFKAAQKQLNQSRLELADHFLTRAKFWHDVPDIDRQIDELQRAINAQLERKKQAAQQQANIQRERQEAAAARKRDNKLRSATNALQQQLDCTLQMDIPRGVGSALQQLAQLNETRANQVRPVVARKLVNCMHRLSRTDPFKTEQLLNQAKILLPDQTILSTTQLDYCRHLTPGSGGKGEHHSCKDRLYNGAWGPTMVAVKTSTSQVTAIGKYEVSFGELEPFCRVTKHCEGIKLGARHLPATNIPLSLAKDYLGWLSFQTGNNYRLPLENEWFIAASANNEREPSDRNCYVKYAGIEKGASMLSAQQGSVNGYGLVNHIGNAQEWVIDTKGRTLATGGHHEDPMNRCTATTKRPHNGKSDSLTGFRVARDIN